MESEERNKIIWSRLDNATKWCVHYCLTHGVDNTVLWRIKKFGLEEPAVTYTLTKNESKDKFISMATKLRELWPKGVREIKGKEYPWRDTVSNLASRLSQLWALRKLDKYTEEDVLQAAGRYVSRFEEDKRYMKAVKYFILQKSKADGFVQDNSILADLLENTIATEDMYPSGTWDSDSTEMEIVDGGFIV